WLAVRTAKLRDFALLHQIGCVKVGSRTYLNIICV
ncbi:hypothetical protein chiPu_0027714, partial [Chiloscyllium punctatum]|nr:hypothetical protein [Chiloscyllium punctatum]